MTAPIKERPCATRVHLFAVPPGAPDARLLDAWNRRQLALARIEAMGDFFDSEEHSPEATREFDAADAAVFEEPAVSLEGAIAKLWTVAQFCLGNLQSDLARDAAAAIRRADALAAIMLLSRPEFEGHPLQLVEAIAALQWLRAPRARPGAGMHRYDDDRPRTAVREDRYSSIDSL